MADWKHKIDLNGVIREMSNLFDLTRVEEQCPKRVRTAIANELSKVACMNRFAKRALKVKSIAEMDRLIDEIYDEADRQLVWLGG